MKWSIPDGKKAIRLKSFGFAGLDYAINVVIIYLYALMGVVDVDVPHKILLMAVLFNLTFFTLIAGNISARFRDPSVTSLQVAAAMVINFYGMYLAPQIAYVFLVNIFIPLAYASLRFNRKQFLAFTCGISATLFAMVFIVRVPIAMTLATLQEQLLACVVFSLALLRYTAINAQISFLRAHLHTKNKSLKEATAKLTLLASHDELTSLLNRRSFLEHLDAIHTLAQENSGTYCVAILDADFFKHINDRFGHLVGDSVLQELGTIFKQSLRDGDVVARYGGEEFAIILPGTDLKNGIDILNRILSRVEGHDWKELLDGRRVTCSSGIAEFEPGASPTEMIAAADHYLYEAKRSGRNQVCAA